MIGTHFYNAHFCGCSKGKKGEGNPNGIVQITNSCGGFKLFGENGMQQFFSGCFSITARQGDDGNSERVSVMCCKMLQSF